MEWWKIALIIGAGILFLFILFVVFVSISNKKKNNRLNNNLQKIQQEKENYDFDKKLVLDQGKSGDFPTVEEYNHEEDKTEENAEMVEDVTEGNFKFDHKEIDFERRKNNDLDFEDFMNEHAFSRKILDRKMVEKLRNLSPEMQAVILNSVFNKFDDK